VSLLGTHRFGRHLVSNVRLNFSPDSTRVLLKEDNGIFV
jgi:hypothetical protein